MVEFDEVVEFVHDQFEFLLSLLEIEVTFDYGVLARKEGELILVTLIDEFGVNLAWKLVEEFGEKFNVDKHDGGIGEFVGDNVEKGFGTKGFALGAKTAAFGFERCQARSQHLRA